MSARKPRPGPDQDPLQQAIAELEALKLRRTQGPADPPDPVAAPAQRRGRPPKGQATPESAPTTPAKRGRKAGPAPAPTPTFGAPQLTAHRPLGLLEVQDRHDLDALLADPRLAPHIAMRLDDRFALVLPASLERLQAALLKVGHTPKLLPAGSAGGSGG